MKVKHVSIVIVFCAITSIGFAQSTTEVQISTGGSTFPGLWQGVDPVDGGNSYRQLLVKSGDIIELRGRDTWHGPCGYGDPAPINGELEKIGFSTLFGTWSLDCQAPPTDVSGDRDLLVEYTYDFRQRTLTETLISPATGEPIDREPIIFYRANSK